MIPLGEDRPAPVFPVSVYLLIAVNAYVFFSEVTAPNFPRFVNSFATIPYDVTHGVTLPPPSPGSALWTLITAQFMHANLLHIFFNMLFLFVFGPEVEYLCGHLRFIAFYLVCGVAGGLAQIAFSPNSHVPVIGASGAIAGVLGAYIVSYPTNSIRTLVPLGFIPLFFRLPAALVIGLWALTQFVSGFSQVSVPGHGDQGGTAYFGHIGGFLAGVLFVGLFSVRSPSQRSYRYRY